MLKKDTFPNSLAKLYTRNSSLYLKNALEENFKLSKYTHLYSYTLDINNKFHICLIDYKSNIVYITFEDNVLNNISSFKLDFNIKNLSNLSVYIMNNSLFTFFIKKVSKNEFIIYNLNYNFNTKDWNLLQVASINKSSNPIYSVSISNNCLLCSYSTYINKTLVRKTLTLDNINNCWNDYYKQKTSQLLIRYCNSIKYK